MKLFSFLFFSGLRASLVPKNDTTEVCYEGLGCFDNEFPWDCLYAQRLPGDPATMTFSYRLYTEVNNYDELDCFNPSPNVDWTAKSKILLATHGWHDSGTTGWLRDTVMKATQLDDYHVIILDWEGEASSLNYVESAQNARVVAAAGAVLLSDALNNGILAENIHITGHSLGGQLMAFLAQRFQTITGAKIGRFTPLDAAGPLFDECSAEARVDESDADYVDFIHTDSGRLPALSMEEAVAYADFYVNDGRHQPGCPTPSLDTNCEHQRAVQIWVSSFDISCYACPCETFQDLENGLCSNNCRFNAIGFYSQKPAQKTTYYIETTDQKPFCVQ